MPTPDTYPRLAVLAERLADATARGEAHWVAIDHPKPPPYVSTPTPAFEYQHPSGAVQIYSRDGDDAAPFEIALVRNGTQIESLSTYWYDEDNPAEWNQHLATLYRVARSEALGIDQLIDEILVDFPARPRSEDDDIPF